MDFVSNLLNALPGAVAQGLMWGLVNISDICFVSSTTINKC